MTGTGDLRACDSSAARETLVGEQRRVDPAREVAQVVERLGRVDLELRHQLERLRGSRSIMPSDQALLDLERDELLLGAVVDVAFEPAALGVLRGDEPAARRAELLDQPHVAEHEARLPGQVADQLLLGRVHRVVRVHRRRDRAELLP